MYHSAMNSFYQKHIPQAKGVTVASALLREGGQLNNHFQNCAAAGFNATLWGTYTQKMGGPTNPLEPREIDQEIFSNALVQTADTGGEETVAEHYRDLPLDSHNLITTSLGEKRGTEYLMGRLPGLDDGLLNGLVHSHDLSFNESYQVWENQRQIDFLKNLGSDSAISLFQEKWTQGTISPEEIQAFGERIHHLHAQAYGYKDARIIDNSSALDEKIPDMIDRNLNGMKWVINKILYAVTPDLYKDTIDKKNELLGGHTDEEGLQITFADKNISLQSKGYLGFINTIAHESQHVFQTQLKNRLEEHQALENKLKREQGIFGRTDVTADEYHIYEKTLPAFLKENLTGGWRKDQDLHLMMGGLLREGTSTLKIGLENPTDPDNDYIDYLASFHESDAYRSTDYTVLYLRSSPEGREEILKNLENPPFSTSSPTGSPEDLSDETLNQDCSTILKPH